MIGYDLRSGDEKWSVGGLPSGCCTSPVTSGGVLFFAGWSPGGPDDPENQMPTFDAILKDADTDGDGVLSRAEGETVLQGFFDSQDSNKDGKITREEWDAILRFMAEGENSVFALEAPGAGEEAAGAEPRVLWRKTRGLPYVASVIVYRGQCVMVKDGGIVTSYDTGTGAEVYQGRLGAGGKYYASPVAANGHIYLTSLDGVVTVLRVGSEEPLEAAKSAKLGERTAATPAIADDTLYVRTEKHLYAFAEAK
jgi:outer membrane protein assembly factor BamB